MLHMLSLNLAAHNVRRWASAVYTVLPNYKNPTCYMRVYHMGMLLFVAG